MNITKSHFFFVGGLILALNSAYLAFAVNQAGSPTLIDTQDQKELIAGWYKCEDTASACKKCASVGLGCGNCSIVGSGALAVKTCIGQLGFATGGCATAAAVKHCKFTCFVNSCAEKTGGGNCGNFQTLAGFLGCECATNGAACATSTCTDSGNTGRKCYECE